MTAFNVVSGGTTRSTNYGYDELSRLKKITSYDGGAWNYAYDEVGNKASLSRPNGVTTTYGYDTLNRLTDLANVKGSTTLSRFNYHLRADGRRDQLNETVAQPDGTSVSRAIQYSFDDANRLTSESGTDGSGKTYSKTYTLDEAGNRQKLIATLDGSTTTTNYSYNDLDWMTAQNVVAPGSTTNTSYDYDANGSQTGITTQVGAAAPSYVKQVWDSEGHMTARGAVDSNGNWGSSRNEYSYDAGGMRLSQSTVAQSGTVSAKTSYLWNGDRLLEERDKDNLLLARYEHGQELGPLSMLRPANGSIAAQTRYFIGDGQDSTRQLLDETGAIKDSYFYDAFGMNLGGNQGTTANSFKYTGQQQDDSGLYYLRARYYEPGSGRFLSHDPVLGNSDDPISMHRYLYTGDDPVDFADPSGLYSQAEGGYVERAIKPIYLATHPGLVEDESVTFGQVQWYNSLGWAGFIGKSPGLNFRGYQLSPRKPDVFNMRDKNYMEIKPFTYNEIYKAIGAMEGNANAYGPKEDSDGNSLNGLGAFYPDTDWNVPGYIIISPENGQTYWVLNIAGVLFYTNVQDEFKKLLKAMPIFLAKGEEGALIRGIANPALQYVETEAVEVGGKVIGRIGIQAVEGQLETQFADAVLIDMQMAA